MKIHIATDHAGLELKTRLVDYLSKKGNEVIDHGAHSYNPADDYPDYVIPAAEAVVSDQGRDIKALGIVLGGSGNGEQIAANKVLGVRAALVWNEFTARKARQHNDANIISIGARLHDEAEVVQLIDYFLEEPYSADERHARRISQITDYESNRDGGLTHEN